MDLKDFLAIYGALHIIFRIILKLIDSYLEHQIKTALKKKFDNNFKTIVFLNKKNVIGKLTQKEAKNYNKNDIVEIDSKNYIVDEIIKFNNCITNINVKEV